MVSGGGVVAPWWFRDGDGREREREISGERVRVERERPKSEMKGFNLLISNK